MKIPNLLISTLTGCLFLGASGTAMAVTIPCTDDPIPAAGVIHGQLVAANVSVNKNCIIKDSIILGTITVLSAASRLALLRTYGGTSAE